MNDVAHWERGLGVRQIAVYGKGGIGKSTISANVSAALAAAGARVLQIGCDPKQDSTRLLVEGRRLVTVLDYLRATDPGGRTPGSVVHTGFSGVACVEAGGPEPGVGCAGRGILSALDLLENLGVGEEGYDIVLYDVLGDVVCGGFAVPLRERYADFIYIVTSGEFMSLYAANNILRGVRNFEERGLRMAGLVFNGRGLPHEDDRVRRFADAVRLPVVAFIPRSRVIGEAEQLGQTVVQAFPDDPVATLFKRLADHVLAFESPLRAHPLAADDLESVVLGGTVLRPSSPGADAVSRRAKKTFTPDAAQPPLARPRRYRSKSVIRHEVLHGCAFNGAAHTLAHIQDTVTVGHGPRSCSYISSHGAASAARRTANRYGRAVLPDRLASPVLSTEMDERVVIFGGNDSLEKGLRNAAEDNPKAIFVVTTCASGIIGDDVRVAYDAAAEALGKTPVITVNADGDINGDYMQGIIDSMIAVADRYIDRTVAPGQDTVNIIAEKNLATNTEGNYLAVKSMLDALGLRVNCRFIRHCTTEEIAHLLRGRVNLLASSDLCGRTIRAFLMDRYGAPFLSSPFPVGFTATAAWVGELAALFGKGPQGENLIRQERAAYEEALDPLRASLEGKRVLVVTQSYQIDWVLDLAFDLGVEIAKVGVLASSWDEDFVTRYEGRLPLALSYTRSERDEDIRNLEPDLTLTNAAWRGQPDNARIDVIPILPDVGSAGGVAVARRWVNIMKLPPKEGWRYDL
jgi:nitrogenase iron protein